LNGNASEQYDLVMTDNRAVGNLVFIENGKKRYLVPLDEISNIPRALETVVFKDLKGQPTRFKVEEVRYIFEQKEPSAMVAAIDRVANSPDDEKLHRTGWCGVEALISRLFGD
jgi:hypothetical protein